VDLQQLDLNLLVVLDALHAERTVGGVARRLKVSQPTVSFSLRKLRDFFGDELFIRTPTGMSPTPLAEQLREPVARILRTLHDEVLRSSDFRPAEARRTFTFSMSDIGELVFLPPLLEQLRAEAPGVTLHTVAMPPAALERAMENGAVDIALGYFPDLTGASFLQQRLFGHPFVCLARRGHPRIGESLTLERFLEEEHVVINAEGRSQEIFERRMSELGLQRRVALRSPHFTTAPLLVATSDLIATVPHAVGLAYAQLLDLKLLVPPLDIPPIDLKQLWHRRVHDDPAVTWIRGVVSRVFLQNDPSFRPDSAIFKPYRS
jgi:DNA-binding transcriptional LysR family regulator